VHDYCAGIVDLDGNIISQNTGGLPIFLADLGAAVTGAIDIYGRDGFKPGDVLVSNDPDVCGQHLNNVVVFSPFFFEGELIAFCALRAHWVDVGGGSSGFGSTNSQQIYDEGIQLSAIKIYKGGELDEELLRLLRQNIRYPDSSLGDLRAQTAACRLGERLLGQLFGKYGRDTVLDSIAAMWDQAEQLARAEIRKIPNGVYTAESWLDSDYIERDKRVPIKIKVIVADEDMTIDFSDISGQVKGPINAGVSGGIAAARVAYKCLVAPTGGVTHGEFRPLKVVLPPGKLLSAQRPAPLGGWSLSLPTVIDTILLALAPALPGRIPAGHKGDMSGYAIAGRDSRRGTPFISMNIYGGGWGGNAQLDGDSAAVSICQGDVQTAPVEVQEAYYPVLVERCALRENSCGSGRHRGGLGVEMIIRPEEDETFLNTQYQRTDMPPWGLFGGTDGMPNEGFVIAEDGTRRGVNAVTRYPLKRTDRLVLRTGGGGGFGDPLERELDKLAEDLRRGYITPDRARDDYQAVVDDLGNLDIAATRSRRSAVA
jgi:N-methylhydantoinase B